MAIATLILGALLALAFLGAGGAKLAGAPAMRQSAEHLGIAFSNYRLIGLLEIAGAIGIVISLLHARVLGLEVGAYAAGGLALLMIGAFATHRKAGDGPSLWAPALVLALIAATFVALRVTSA